MQIIGSRLADQVDVQPQVRTVLCRVVPALHLHFGDHVRAWPCRRRGDQVIHDRNTVERHAALNFTLAGADEVLSRGHVVIAGRRSNGDIRRGCGNLQGVMPHQRQILHRLGIEGFAQRGVIRLYRWGRGRNGNSLSLRSSLEREVCAYCLIDRHDGARLRQLAKACLLNRNVVGARRNELDRIVALCVGRTRINHSGRFFHGGHLGADHRAAGRIQHRSHQGGIIGNLSLRKSSESLRHMIRTGQRIK